MNILEKVKNHFRNLPEHKKYFEVITAFLSIPVLLSVIYLNYSNIQSQKKPQPDPTPQVSQDNRNPTIIVTLPQDDDEQPTPSAECTPGIGNVEIVSPRENSTVDDNPLEINIDYDPDGYCAVVWSYRINGGRRSDFTDNDIEIYNMESGQKTLELTVKSIVNGEEEILDRNFTYENTNTVPTAPPQPTSMVSPTP